MSNYNDLINPNIPLTEKAFLDYVLEKGIDNVKKDDLIKVVSAHKLKTWDAIPGFNELFYFKLNEENNHDIKEWTKRMGWLTIIMAIMTAVQVFKLFT